MFLSSGADGRIKLWSVEANKEYESNPHASMINCVPKACYGFKVKNKQYFDTPTSIHWLKSNPNHFVSGYVNS